MKSLDSAESPRQTAKYRSSSLPSLRGGKQPSKPHAPNMEELRRRISPTHSEAGGQVGMSETDDLEERLACALEAKNFAGSRLDELKRAMVSMEKNHEAVIVDLKQQLLLAKRWRSEGDHSKDSDLTTEEVTELKNQLRVAEQERNVLLNTLEWKEVQWKNKVENMEMQKKVEMDELRHQNELKMKEKLELAEENEELRKKLEIVQKQKAELQEQLRFSAWSGLLRCPVRNSACSDKGEACYCQETCWRVLNAMQGVTALLCNVGDLQIFDASKSAHMTWGSSLLHGQSILTLVNGPLGAAWLRKAFQVHQQIAETEQKEIPGFIVRDLGCQEFTNKQGQVFDSSVITAHFPSEPKCGKGAAWLVLIEPLTVPSTSSEPSRGWAQQSTQSVVSSVNPSDSASNIFF